VSISEDTKAPTASSIAPSGPGITNDNGDLNAGKVVTLTLSMSESVTVSGTPQLILNNGGMASYTVGSGSNSLAFTYTVAAGQDTADLEIAAFNPNGGAISDLAGNAASLTNGANTIVVAGSALRPERHLADRDPGAECAGAEPGCRQRHRADGRQHDQSELGDDRRVGRDRRGNGRQQPPQWRPGRDWRQ
jgi:hypothetical protein